MSFSSGFAAGWGAIEAAERTRTEQQRAKADQDLRAAQLAIAQAQEGRMSEEYGRQKATRQAVADAAAEPTVGQSVAGNFTSNPSDAAALQADLAAEAEMRGTAAPAVQAAASSGNKATTFDSEQKAARFASERAGRSGYAMRLADAYARTGEADKAMAYTQQWKALSKEGYKDALDALFRTGGDAEAAQSIFNETGSMKIGGRLVAEPTKRVGKDGVEMPDFKLSVVSPDGSVREIGSALTMRYMADGPENLRSMLSSEAQGSRQERQVSNQERGTDAQIRQGDRRLDLSEQQVGNETRNTDSVIADRTAQRAIASAGLALRQAASRIDQERWDNEKTGGASTLQSKLEGMEKALGRKLTDVERTSMILGKSKSAEANEGFINDATKEYQKQKPDATPEQMATFRADLVRQLSAAPAAIEVESRIKSLPKDQQAAAAAEASQKYRLQDSWFEARGLPKPVAPQPARPAAQAASAPAAPAVRTPSATPAAIAQSNPQVQSYISAVEALRANQQRLGAAAAKASPEDQARISQEITKIGGQIQRTIEQARALGIEVR